MGWPPPHPRTLEPVHLYVSATSHPMPCVSPNSFSFSQDGPSSVLQLFLCLCRRHQVSQDRMLMAP